jgi:proline iminopeptidase
MKATLVFAVFAWACATSLLPGSTAGLESKRNTTPRENHIPVGNTELYSREVGQGTAIIVLHGGPDFDHSYLLPELDRLSDSYHLIYYDQRGRGQSADGVKPEDVTLASDIEDIEKVRLYYHLDSVVLLGHSWGTVLALEYALRYPGRVSHLILMNPGPASEADYKQLRNDWLEKRAEDMERRKAIAATAAYKEADPDAVVAYYRIHFKPALARPDDYEKLITRMQASFIRQGSAGIIKARAVESRLMTETWASPGYDLLPRLKSLRIPTMVITGDHEFIPSSTAEHISQSIPNARMVTLKDCGHFSYLESPVAVHEQIDALLRSKVKPARPR